MPAPRRCPRIAVVLAAAVLAVVTLRPDPAGAHTEVQRAEPQPGTEVAPPIHQVRLTFLDPVRPGATIEVAADDGAPVAGLGATELSGDRRVASVRFDALAAPGGYVVDYRFTAQDGDEQQESFRFTVCAPAAGDDDGAEGLRFDAGGTVGAAMVSLAILASFALALRRRRGTA